MTAEIVKEYSNGCTIEKWTYSADNSATGKAFTMYEVYNNDELLNAFDSLQEAIDYMNNQKVWENLISFLPFHKAIAKY